MTQNNLFRTITSNTLSQSFGKAISIIIGLVVTGLLTRNLGESGYGQYTLIATLILFFNSISDWGTGFIATRMAAQTKYPEPQIYSNLLIYRIIASLVSGIIMTALVFFQAINLPINLVLIGSLVLFALSLRNTMQVIFQVHLKLEFGAIVEVVSSLTFFVLTYIAVSKSILNVQNTILILLFSSIASGLIALTLGIKLSTLDLRLNIKLIKYLLKEAAPMGALLVVFSIYNRLDTFILQFYQGDTAVGIYGLAYKVHDNLVMGAAFFMTAMYPLIAKAKNPQKMFSTSFHILFVTGAVISIIFSILAQPVIMLLGGTDYLQAVNILRILLIATSIAYLNHLTGYTLAARGLQKISLSIAIIALVINLGLNYIFIPIYSYTASAFITIITEGVVLVGTLVYLSHKQKLKPHISAIPSTLKNLFNNRQQLF